jgi:hypothetical protein
VGLTVWAPGDERRCVECVERVEFVPGVGRRLRGFIRWRLLRDDRFEDESRVPVFRSRSRNVIDDQREEQTGQVAYGPQGGTF